MQMDRLSALDRIMLWASRRWPQDIGMLAVLDGEPLLDADGQLRIELVRAAIAARLHLVPRFRQRILTPRRGLGGPLWVDAHGFDIARHVRELRLEAPTGEAQLLAAVEGLLRQRLDPTQPLWEMWLLTGLPERRLGLFVRIHHSIADGMAAMATIVSLLDRVPRATVQPPQPWTPSPWPSGRELLADNVSRGLRGTARVALGATRLWPALRRARAAWPAVREILAEQPATETSIDRMVGSGRRLAVVHSELAAVKSAGRRRGGTVNDVLLSSMAAGLRALLRSRGESVGETTIRVYVPVSLRRRLRGPQEGNLIAQMAVPLRLGIADAGRRLDDIVAETRKRKARARTSPNSLMVGGAIGRRLMLFAVMRQRVNATSASIRGPAEPLFLAGARVREVVPLLPLVADEPLGVGALSYAGALTIGVVADRDTFPDLDVFTDAVRAELDALRGATAPGGEDTATRAGAVRAVPTGVPLPGSVAPPQG